MVLMKVIWKNDMTGYIPRVIEGLVDLSEHMDHNSIFGKNVQIALQQPDEANIEL